MDVKDFLIKARAKVEQGWCQGASARDSQGQSVGVTAPTAASWCIYGAFESVPYSDSEYHLASALLANINKSHGETDLLSVWNDAEGRTQADVLALFDRAIAAKV